MAKVLIVDDHPGMAEAVAATVRSEGYEVAVVHGGAEALEYVRGPGAVDLMVLDAMMPGVSGLDVLEELRRAGAERRPPVVMYSGHDSARGEAERLGAVAFVSKVEPDKLLAAIDVHTGKVPPPRKWAGGSGAA